MKKPRKKTKLERLRDDERKWRRRVTISTNKHRQATNAILKYVAQLMDAAENVAKAQTTIGTSSDLKRSLRRFSLIEDTNGGTKS